MVGSSVIAWGLGGVGRIEQIEFLREVSSNETVMVDT